MRASPPWVVTLAVGAPRRRLSPTRYRRVGATFTPPDCTLSDPGNNTCPWRMVSPPKYDVNTCRRTTWPPCSSAKSWRATQRRSLYCELRLCAVRYKAVISSRGLLLPLQLKGLIRAVAGHRFPSHSLRPLLLLPRFLARMTTMMTHPNSGRLPRRHRANSKLLSCRPQVARVDRQIPHTSEQRD